MYCLVSSQPAVAAQCLPTRTTDEGLCPCTVLALHCEAWLLLAGFSTHLVLESILSVHFLPRGGSGKVHLTRCQDTLQGRPSLGSCLWMGPLMSRSQVTGSLRIHGLPASCGRTDTFTRKWVSDKSAHKAATQPKMKKKLSSVNQLNLLRESKRHEL